jgi:hypothetical protein
LKSGINAVLNDFWDLIMPGDGIERLESGFILLGFGFNLDPGKV